MSVHPGQPVAGATSGASAQLGLTYYFYPKGSTALSVGFTSSARMLPDTSMARITVSCCEGSVMVALGRAMALDVPTFAQRAMNSPLVAGVYERLWRPVAF